MDIVDTMDNVLNFEIGGFSLGSLLSALLLSLLCLLVVKLLLKAVDGMLAKMHLDQTLLSILRSLIKMLLLFIGVLIVMGYLGIPVTSLVALLSVAGLAISLSVQNFLNNVAGGVQLLYHTPLKPAITFQPAAARGPCRR